MATLVRSFIRCRNLLTLQRKTPHTPKIWKAYISTSKKKKEALNTKAEELAQDYEIPDDEKNWMSYGISETDKEADAWQFHFDFLTIYTILFTSVIYVWAYGPDKRQTDWATREAFLELERRERLGLPPIDPDLVDPSKFTLPTDEELGDMEIIV